MTLCVFDGRNLHVRDEMNHDESRSHDEDDGNSRDKMARDNAAHRGDHHDRTVGHHVATHDGYKNYDAPHSRNREG